MQVRVTIEVTDTERLIIGAYDDGMFHNASRESIQDFITSAYKLAISEPVRVYSDMTKDTVELIKASLKG